MYAASRHGTHSLTSLAKDGGVSCFSRSSGGRPCLTSVKLMELAGPLGHSPWSKSLFLSDFYLSVFN